MSFGASSIRIELLASHHARSIFRCGQESLDRYIREQATQDARRDIARVFVATATDDPSRILGFFTLSATSIAATDLPPEIGKRLPRYPVPAALIGRLAVDQEFARQGLGGILTTEALKKAAAASETVAVNVMVVDPIEGAAHAFYAAFGFRGLREPSRRMFLNLPRGAVPTP